MGVAGFVGREPEIGELRFDVPLEEVYAGVGASFGQMIATSLRSAKWDKRCEALKAIAAILNASTGPVSEGFHLQDRKRCWRLTCQLLNFTMRDKVMPVRLASHELFMEALSPAPDGAADYVGAWERRMAVDVLVEAVIDRLGDSSLRLHESARRCVHFAAAAPELLGPSATLARLRSRAVEGQGGGSKASAGERIKTLFGVLDTVDYTLRRFQEERSRGVYSAVGAMPWTEDDMVPFIITGLDDSFGPRVRLAAVALAVTAYRFFGADAMEPLLASLRPAKQQLLRERFRAAEADATGAAGSAGAAGAASAAGAAGAAAQGDAPAWSAARSSSFGGLLGSSGSLKPPPGYTLPPLHRTPEPDLDFDDEEFLMDGILEEAGMVFSSTMAEISQMMSPRDRDDEQRILEAELIALGLDLEGLDEQRALLSSLRDTWSVEVY